MDETVHEVTLVWGQTSIVEIFNREKATLRLKKVDVETKAPIYGVVFNLYDAKNNLLGEYTTDQEGIIEFPKELPAGKYKLKEVQAAGYVVDPTIRTVEVKSAQYRYLTKQIPQKGGGGSDPAPVFLWGERSDMKQAKVHPPPHEGPPSPQALYRWFFPGWQHIGSPGPPGP